MSAALILIHGFTEDGEEIEQADDDGWKIIVVVFIDVMVWFNWFRGDWIELETSIRIGIFGNGQEFLSVSKNSATYVLLLCDLADSFLRRILKTLDSILICQLVVAVAAPGRRQSCSESMRGRSGFSHHLWKLACRGILNKVFTGLLPKWPKRSARIVSRRFIGVLRLGMGGWFVLSSWWTFCRWVNELGCFFVSLCYYIWKNWSIPVFRTARVGRRWSYTVSGCIQIEKCSWPFSMCFWSLSIPNMWNDYISERNEVRGECVQEGKRKRTELNGLIKREWKIDLAHLSNIRKLHFPSRKWNLRPVYLLLSSSLFD